MVSMPAIPLMNIGAFAAGTSVEEGTLQKMDDSPQKAGEKVAPIDFPGGCHFGAGDGEVVCCDDRGLAAFAISAPPRERGARVPPCLRSARARRRRPAPGAPRGPQGDARQHSAQSPGGRAAERTPRAPRGRRRVPPRVQDGAGRHRLEAIGFALPFRPLARLAQVQEPGGACRQA
jgi:hypothetical protein